MKHNPVKKALRSGQPSVGTWLSLCSPVAARFLARTPFRWLTVDVEHSAADWETAATILDMSPMQGEFPLPASPRPGTITSSESLTMERGESSFPWS